jgi:hypothetical protein
MDSRKEVSGILIIVAGRPEHAANLVVAVKNVPSSLADLLIDLQDRSVADIIHHGSSGRRRNGER